MALARTLLREDNVRIGEVARRVGHRSASTFSVAFARHVGMSHGQFSGQQAAS